MTNRLKRLGTTALAAVVMAASLATQAAEAPNFVVIFTDDGGE